MRNKIDLAFNGAASNKEFYRQRSPKEIVDQRKAPTFYELILNGSCEAHTYILLYCASNSTQT